VAKLNPALPELVDAEGNPLQFRRTLLNKCQVEFETGVLAMKAVADREEREKGKEPVEEPAEPEAEAKEPVEKEGEEGEEGEIEEDPLVAAKRKDRETAKAEVAARKRMLGNMIFVGQLYRFGVLTESVMHSCIKQLLEEVRSLRTLAAPLNALAPVPRTHHTHALLPPSQTTTPRPEDVECLCKLMTTVGRPMDASTRVIKQANDDGSVTSISTRDMMGVYFKRIDALQRNEALDSRHRFMLHDLIDLRRNNWVLRRKTEGPKKIEDIHRDAAMEKSRAEQMARQGPPRGRDGPLRGRDGPPARPQYDTRLDAPIRTINRVGAPDSAGTQGQSFRPGGRPAPPPAR
jgi:translation initiation factor 4G